MPAKKVSAPKPPKSKRPSFSAPKPPQADPEEVLENNDEEEEEIAVLRETVTEETEVVEEKKEAPVQEADVPKEDVVIKKVKKVVEAEEDLDAVLDDIEADEMEDEPMYESGGVSVVNLIIFVLLLLFGLVGWFLYLQETGMFALQSTTTPADVPVAESSVTPTEAIAEAPTPTVTQLSREDISLEVLNGSGVSGRAGRVADQLEALGYEGIEVGNANATDENELYVNPEYEGQVEVLLEDLASELDISTVSGELTDSELVGRVVLGG